MLKLKDLRVGDVMTPMPRTLSLDATVVEAVGFLIDERVTGAPVVDAEGDVLTVVSRADLLHFLAPGLADGPEALEAMRRRTLRNLPHATAVTCNPDTSFAAACKQMIKSRVHRLVVVDNGHPVGVVSTTDAVRTIACFDEVASISTPIIEFEPFREGVDA